MEYFDELREKNKKDFIRNAKLKFGEKFDFSNIEYVNSKTKIELVCLEHGRFSITPNSFLKSVGGCPKCGTKLGGKKRGIARSNGVDKFAEMARKIHGDKYDYSKVEYVNNHTKVRIICPKHGEFWQMPDNHLSGNGCPECASENRCKILRKKLNDFIKESEQVHNGKYDYSKFEYKNANTKGCIICPKHGEFWQDPHNHLRGHGCPYCDNKFMNTIDFITKSKLVHNDRYNYSKVDYVNSDTKVKIICPIHGEFLQTPFNHLQNHGCPKCSSPISKWEQEVSDFIRSLGIECEQSNRSILDGKEIDIFVPSYNIGIECDGLRWHNELYRDKKYHLEKTNECLGKGVRLIHIFEDEWVFKKDIWQSMLRNIFGLTNEKIYARKCTIKEVIPSDARQFLDTNHIQGYSNSSINYGLYYDDELVSLMTFGKPRINLGGKREDGSYELVRFCNRLNVNVIGAASKLFKHFIKEYSPNLIVSYSDKRWSLGRLYEILGFEHMHDSRPNYYYVDGLNRKNRFGFRKSVLIGEGYDPSKSEHEIMLERGIYRIYDCGTMVWKWNDKG